MNDGEGVAPGEAVQVVCLDTQGAEFPFVLAQNFQSPSLKSSGRVAAFLPPAKQEAFLPHQSLELLIPHLLLIRSLCIHK